MRHPEPGSVSDGDSAVVREQRGVPEPDLQRIVAALDLDRQVAAEQAEPLDRAAGDSAPVKGILGIGAKVAKRCGPLARQPGLGRKRVVGGMFQDMDLAGPESCTGLDRAERVWRNDRNVPGIGMKPVVSRSCACRQRSSRFSDSDWNRVERVARRDGRCHAKSGVSLVDAAETATPPSGERNVPARGDRGTKQSGLTASRCNLRW